MPAIWNSYSKSETARRPRRITRAPCARTNSMSSVEKPTTSTLAIRREHLARHRDALVGREERLLGLAVGDADDDPVEQLRRAPHQVLVAARDRIERSGIDDLDHGIAPSDGSAAADDNAPARPVACRRTASGGGGTERARPRRRRSPPAGEPRGAAGSSHGHGSSANGGSRKITSKRRRLGARATPGHRPRGPRARRAERRAPSPRAPRPAPRLRSTATASAAPRDSGFERQRAAAGEKVEGSDPVRSWPSQLNSVSRTRSGVGRKPGDARETRITRPRKRPPMMRHDSRGRRQGFRRRPMGAGDALQTGKILALPPRRLRARVIWPARPRSCLHGCPLVRPLQARQRRRRQRSWTERLKAGLRASREKLAGRARSASSRAASSTTRRWTSSKRRS